MTRPCSRAVKLLLVVALANVIPTTTSAAGQGSVTPYHKWSHGPSGDPTFFPIAVWLQNPSRAERYIKS